METIVKDLPAPALLALGAVLGLGFLVRYFGLMQGQKAAPEHAASSAQVAAVIVDPAALNRATAAMEAMNLTLIETNMIALEHNKFLAHHTDELDRIREELRIQREVNRR